MNAIGMMKDEADNEKASKLISEQLVDNSPLTRSTSREFSS
jgi:hypothetical protein